ncbi:MAG TPA: HAD-IIB family hydrolase [Alphaproteobacteria bacterium]|nr:HAD-IIB family hydrolase [Alphaproteobacteria bacterium]
MLRHLRFILCDIDDTVTTEGKLTARAYTAMERLSNAGLAVIPITGRPGGWCDHIARMWPVAAVVGENGAFYFRYDRARRIMQRRFWLGEEERKAARARLERLRTEIIAAVPRAGIASDQPYREADLAVDFAEDVGPLDRAEIDRIVAVFEAAGARAKISSIHVNGWFGDFDKLAMTRVMLREVFAVDLDREKASCLFIGDSPNDSPMFGFFPVSVGVANVRDFEDRLPAPPAYVTRARAGDGFAEMAERVLAGR